MSLFMTISDWEGFVRVFLSHLVWRAALWRFFRAKPFCAKSCVLEGGRLMLSTFVTIQTLI